jgi:hypothetical protein
MRGFASPARKGRCFGEADMQRPRTLAPPTTKSDNSGSNNEQQRKPVIGISTATGPMTQLHHHALYSYGGDLVCWHVGTMNHDQSTNMSDAIIDPKLSMRKARLERGHQ